MFVNIKVDREERPDIDRIYQTAHSLLTQRPGGWPLTVFLTPDDHVPFFAGTYFPREPRHGLPSFRELMQRIDEYLANNEADIRRQNTYTGQCAAGNESQHTRDIHQCHAAGQCATGARAQLRYHRWRFRGGTEVPASDQPRTPVTALGTQSQADGMEDRRALHMAVFTLEKMAHGGLFDQLGGGFCRYSVDNHWVIPHFEKMLYDNGALLALYGEAWAATGNPLFERIAHQTAGWVMREMQAPEGGYYSSLDADSEGEEGRFYVWTPATVRALLDADDYRLFARRYGLDRDANFEGHWHLHVNRTIDQLAEEFDSSRADIEAALARASDILFRAREQRIRPGRDDKVLTAWNGLMIRGMAIAGRHTGATAWTDSAERALDFIRAELWRDNRLLATYKDGRAHLNAYLDDYVHLIDGILELLQVRWRSGDLDFAIELAEIVLARFNDPDGGFFFTSDDHEQLIQRSKPNHDDAMPSGNGIAAKVLGRLGHLLGETRYLEAAERTLKSVWSGMESMPHGHTSLLQALEESLFPYQCVVIRGAGEDLEDWRRQSAQPYAPARYTLAIPDNINALPGDLNNRTGTGHTLAYICNGMTCGTPVSDRDLFLHQLDLQRENA